MPKKSITPEERFWKKVDKNGPVPKHRSELGPCWLWTAAKQKPPLLPYGLFAVGLKMLKAHRFSWELRYNQIPDGMCVLHHCDRGDCVRPQHLFLGTHLDNATDRDSKGRSGTVGERQHKHKITEEQVLELRSLYAQARIEVVSLGRHGRPKGFGSKSLARKRFIARHGHIISKAEANGIMAGRYWKHLL